MSEVVVNIKNSQTDFKISSAEENLIKKCCEEVVKEENFKNDVEICVSLVSSEFMKELNFKYRKKDYVTDVLSFSTKVDDCFLEDENFVAILGDVVICVKKAIEQADEFNCSLNEELKRLVVHSMFHLFGYDHEKSEIEEAVMQKKEEKTLAKIDSKFY